MTPAGMRRLDSLFAERVLKCRVVWDSKEYPSCGCHLTDGLFRSHPEHHWDDSTLELHPFTQSLDAAWEGVEKLGEWTFAICRPHSGNWGTVLATNAIGARPYPSRSLLYELGNERQLSVALAKEHPDLPNKWVIEPFGKGETALAVVKACLYASGCSKEEVEGATG